MIVALQEALILKADEVRVKSDSELMCKQISGVYAVKHENIKPLFAQVKHLVTGFKSFQIAHVPREQNREADRLVRQVLKKQVRMAALMLMASERKVRAPKDNASR